ncbi:hypothetical protein RKE29_19635 [Streptomyces sp. B1866]|uniref:Rv1733c family protein n=1 Tax=Streptomyces sp. B1866 TaxID=3075431 RepID=UPI00288D1445|nr:hypothetical protein [Streptomyces sp. B1866]MDT3398832.1 hypothetical protein [Streptomyces sp. B1866]
MTVRSALGVWRWRRNPLRRGTDLVEAWLALAALLLIGCAAPAAGWVAGSRVDAALTASVREQRAHRHLARAAVVRVLPRGPGESDAGAAGREARRRVVARWTAPDGGVRTGTLPVLPGVRPGDRVPVWTDDLGRQTSRPMAAATAVTRAVLAGVGAAAGVAALVEAARRLVLWRLVRRRHAGWDLAWERAGQDWGRAGAGS